MMGQVEEFYLEHTLQLLEESMTTLEARVSRGKGRKGGKGQGKRRCSHHQVEDEDKGQAFLNAHMENLRTELLSQG